MKNKMTVSIIFAAALFMSACGSSSNDTSTDSPAPPTNSATESDRQLSSDPPVPTSGWVYTDGAKETDEGYVFSRGILEVIATGESELTVIFELPNPCTDARVKASGGEAIGVELETRSNLDGESGCSQVITETQLVVSLPNPIGDRPIEAG